jgi:3',5'-cyclic AMP phosphodiesterase CpdA
MRLRQWTKIQEMLRPIMFRKLLPNLLLVVAVMISAIMASEAQVNEKAATSRPVVIAHLSDLHIGLRQNPMTHAGADPAAQLTRAIEMINSRGVDAIIVTGDIGDNPSGWPEARELLKKAKAPVYVVPGNHDVSHGDPAAFRAFWGRDYFTFRVRDVEFICLDSQLLGNYDHMNAPEPEPLPTEGVREAETMLAWLKQVKKQSRAARVRIAVQHVPIFSGGRAPDAKVYWTTHEPWRSQELGLLHELGVRHVLAGHWHKSATIDEDGISEHVAPSIGFAGAGVPIGFELQIIASDGSVKSEFVACD